MLPGLRPAATTRVMTSRSEKIPTSRPSRSTGSAPMLRSVIRRAASSTLISGLALCVGLYAIARYLANEVVTGWTSTVVIVSFLSGINLLMSGIMGLYIGRIYAEVKRRPLYVVEQRIGFAPGQEQTEEKAQPQAAARPAALRITG